MLSVIVDWIKTTGLHSFSTSSYWVFPTAETLHFMGLTVLFGALLLLDGRGLGFLKSIPINIAHRFAWVALGAFSVNLFTGIVFIFTDPDRYFINIAFQTKMALIIIAGINALIFEFVVYRPAARGLIDIDNSYVAKFCSGLSLVLWSLIIIGGRLIPYVEY